ncbi:MAG: HAD family hydrolase [Myxococcota bacterium]
MPVRAISLDLFDTLVDIHMDRLPLVEIGGRRIPSTYGLLHAASVHWHGLDFEKFAAALGRVDREQRDAMRREHVEFATLDRFRAFGRSIARPGDEMARALTATHMAELRKHVRFHPHHAQVLARLRGRVKLAVCSNFSHTDTARAVLAEAGLLEHFDAVVISMDLGVRKPRPEIFRAALDSLGVAPEQTLHVGDDLEADVAGAAALGVRPVWITRRVADPEAALASYAGAPPAHAIADLAELEKLAAS